MGRSSGWGGVLIAQVAIAFHPARQGAPPGSVVRAGTTLAIAVTDGSRSSRRTYYVPLVGDLPPCADGETAGFRRWELVKGSGADRRVLFAVSVRDEA